MVLNFVGTGNLTRFFIECLKEQFEIGYILSRDLRKATNLSKTCGGHPATIDNHPTMSGVVFVIVPDKYIEDVAKHLKMGDAVLMHCSGFLSSDIFKRKKRASLHPNFSFSNLKKALEMRKQIIFGIEGDEEGVATAIEIVKAISGKYLLIPSEKKKMYHLAAVIVSNFPIALASISKKIYSLLGIEKPEELIHALMKGVVDNLKEIGVEGALTGPVKRGDWEVVEAERMVFEKIFGSYTLYDEIVKILKEVAGSERDEVKKDER
ncbi:Rossmann-like and DUF2520 domain-containing protein [Thermotoga sp. KOL6]|uniref:Rossmann-like and DUF2520 domain-containing protein n=1 Tax=Thermotoga sp. KOL6 TaxID=126741 RepID=UPI000C78783F|nr:DUF2520 domain-containing protein [Thermotoga sp. KOL6]PLV60111.1 hypothetical protein AS005_02135 [Thermotoga sp. KOL6]